MILYKSNEIAFKLHLTLLIILYNYSDYVKIIDDYSSKPMISTNFAFLQSNMPVLVNYD